MRFITLRISARQKAFYYNDFEGYQHGIMSAFLLMKNLQAFQDIDYCRPDWMTPVPSARTLSMHDILASISNHTSDSYQISQIDKNSFLTFVDELEEFSRISRASQNREYVEEFCDTALYMKDGWLNIVFEFNNANPNQWRDKVYSEIPEVHTVFNQGRICTKKHNIIVIACYTVKSGGARLQEEDAGSLVIPKSLVERR